MMKFRRGKAITIFYVHKKELTKTKLTEMQKKRKKANGTFTIKSDIEPENAFRIWCDWYTSPKLEFKGLILHFVESNRIFCTGCAV